MVAVKRTCMHLQGRENSGGGGSEWKAETAPKSILNVSAVKREEKWGMEGGGGLGF